MLFFLQSDRTPPGSAEIRKVTLKKLEGATPKISQMILRQRAVQSAHCTRSKDLPKVSFVSLLLSFLIMINCLFQISAYGCRLLCLYAGHPCIGVKYSCDVKQPSYQLFHMFLRRSEAADPCRGNPGFGKKNL